MNDQSQIQLDESPMLTGVDPKRVLLLEDEGAFTDLLKTYLELNGYVVTGVHNGVEGLKSAMALDYDIILCDMMMPNLPGDMFYIALERIKPHLCKRFIFMTGYRGDKKIEDFIRKVQGVLLWKPFELDDLLDTMRMIVGTTAK